MINKNHHYYYLIRVFLVNRFPYLLILVNLFKFIYGLLTSTSELYRICYSECKKSNLPQKITSDCITEIDQSILYSKQLTIERRAIEATECGLKEITQMILLKKRFPKNGDMETPEAIVLNSALQIIHDSHKVIAHINTRVSTPYDPNNKLHEQKLFKLWSLLMPNTTVPKSRSKQWTEIGFQGDNPATDFRGMGVHGLDDLTYLAKTHPKLAEFILKSSHDPISWFSMAIVGINISSYIVSLLRTRRLQSLMYQYQPTKDTVHEFYCYVFARFIEHWTIHEGQPPLQIIDFEREFKKLSVEIDHDLLLQTIDLNLHLKYS